MPDQIGRQVLLDTLLAAAPALAAKSGVGALNMFWFDKHAVFTTNGSIGIDLPFESSLEGGVEGAPLLGLLSNLTDDSLEISPAEETVQITTEQTVAKLAMVPLEQNLWQFGAVKSKHFTPLLKEFVAALKPVLISVRTNSQYPDRAGVTIKATKGVLELFTTDNVTISYFKLDHPNWPDGTFILPALFCIQLIKNYEDGGFIAFYDDFIVIENADKQRLFSRLIKIVERTPYEQYLDRLLHPDVEEKAVSIPESLGPALQRILLLGDKKFVDFNFSADGLSLEINDDRLSLKEWLPLDNAVPKRTLTLVISLVKRVLDYAQRMFPTDECLILLGDDGFIHFIGIK